MAQAQIISVPSDSYELLTVDPEFNLNATVDSNLPLFYESQNNNVVNIDSNGNVRIVGFGKTLIKIFNRGDFNWSPLEKFILIDVRRKKQSINFFLIPNKYLGEPNFSLSPYAFSTSGLPLKYKSLTPNIANIGENGDVLMYSVGTAQFEVIQEGNFEWEEVKVINEFGISHRHYPFNLSLTSKNTSTLVKFNLYQNINNKYENVGKISGGLYFGDAKYSLNTGLFLITGDYIGVINYEPVVSGEVSTLSTFYSFSTGIYSGNKQEKYVSFMVNRSGFLSYGIDIIIQGIFDENNGYKYASQLALESGIFWSGSFPPLEKELLFTLPLFYNNKIESDTFGKLKFTFINKSGIPESLIQMGEFEEATFVISSGASSIVGKTGILPYFPKNLGSDFLNFKPATLKPESYPI
jgi:hypothetical protein